MSVDQVLTLLVLVAVVAALIWDKLRPDVVALAGAAFLLMTGVVRPVEVQAAFASPAIVALASLFVIAYAMELSGLLDTAIARLVRLCKRIGTAGIWVLIGVAGSASAFLNNTPIVVLGAPVVRDVARSLNCSPKRYLIPLSYAAVLGGCCTLIGTSTNLLVNDMAVVAGQPRFGILKSRLSVLQLRLPVVCTWSFSVQGWSLPAMQARRRPRPRQLTHPRTSACRASPAASSDTWSRSRTRWICGRGRRWRHLASLWLS